MQLPQQTSIRNVFITQLNPVLQYSTLAGTCPIAIHTAKHSALTTYGCHLIHIRVSSLKCQCGVWMIVIYSEIENGGSYTKIY